jgi:hypothetical protein
MIELSSIRGRHRGQTIAVLGGGPSLLNDLKRVPFDAILIGVNQHTLLLNLDYIFYLDEAVFDAVKDSDAPLCTHHRAQCHIWTGVIPEFDISGPAATWMADYLGADRIIVAGCDNYSGARRYWHSTPGERQPDAISSSLGPWKKCRDYMARPEIVRAVSGPLTEIFKSL